MKFRMTPIASAIVLALLGASSAAEAQQQSAPATAADSPTQIETIVVKGYRSSLEQSLTRKRDADGVTEVISAEDIGKLPDKNVADAVQRVPGVTISSAAGGEGGFDEADRVSLRGTNPSLTQTLVNGHAISSGDWFVLDQVGLVGRSTSFSLLPSELVSRIEVHKSQQADLVEGGVAGAVDIITRRPLEFKKQLTLEGSAQAVYADLPGKTDPQFSGLINWKNDASTAGVMMQAFSEKRHLRRDGQEILGYGQIAPTSAMAQAHPDLANVYYPNLIGSALFEQERERNGGLIDVEIKPTKDLAFNLSGFYSKLNATNYNRNWMFWGAHVINGGAGQTPSAYTVQNGTLTSAVFPNTGTPGSNSQYAIVDNIYRPGSYAETSFLNLDASYRVSDKLKFTGQIGTTKGTGETPKQGVFEGDVFNTGATYNMHGIGSPVDVTFPNGNPANFAGTTLDWIFGASPARSEDKETYFKLDGEYVLDAGMFTDLKFGVRSSEHKRDTVNVAQGPLWSSDPFNVANLPNWGGLTYPGDFASGLGGNFPRNVWQLDPRILEAWGDLHSNRDPLAREFWSGEFALKEKINALYVMSNLSGSGWSGNVGVRLVKTREEVTVNTAIPGSVCAPLAPCSVPGAITTSAFGSFYKRVVTNDYTDILPSLNLKFDLRKDLVGRLAVARTMARPDYSALGGAVTADDVTHTGNGGNPNLKPIRSTNFDAALEWYFAPRSLLSGGLFYMDLSNYVGFGTYQTTMLNVRANSFDTYTISAPTNSSGKVKGFELAYQAPLWGGFGVNVNYTYADAREDGYDGGLVGASKNTYNLVGYYENDRFSARLAYTFRSHFLVGLDRSSPEYQDDLGTLAASLSYTVMPNVILSFDALNLNNPKLKYYANSTDQPRAFYMNGRQYYAGVRVNF